MSCEKYIELISATLDGEATLDERNSVESHVQHCEGCRQRLESRRALKHAVGRLQGRASPPEAVQARIEALRFRLPRRRRWLRHGLVASVLVAGLLVAIFVGRSWLDEERGPSLSDELIVDHLKYVPEEMPAEVASDDESEVLRFFAGKVDFEPRVPQLQGTRLIGGRACRIEGQMVQLLFYERGGRKLSLYVSDGSMQLDGCRGRGGHHVCGHRRGNLSLMLVGDASDTELRTLLDSATM